jgi:hypothetical protein
LRRRACGTVLYVYDEPAGWSPSILRPKPPCTYDAAGNLPGVAFLFAVPHRPLRADGRRALVSSTARLHRRSGAEHGDFNGAPATISAAT